jgi:hypothetical protein
MPVGGLKRRSWSCHSNMETSYVVPTITETEIPSIGAGANLVRLDDSAEVAKPA